MKRIWSSIILVMALAILSMPTRAGVYKKVPSLKEITGYAFVAYPGGVGIQSMDNGEFYTIISSDRQSILRYSYNGGVDRCDTLFSIARARNCNLNRIDGYQIGPKGKHILLYSKLQYIYRRSWKADIYHYDVSRNRVEPLSEKGGKCMIPTFSPDGKMVAFVRNNNIFIKKFDFDTEVQVTTDGTANKIINGATDWVYEEELEQTNLMSWSPDGNFLAFVRTDETKVPMSHIQFFLGHLYPASYDYKYPKAGEPNSIVSVRVYNVIDRTLKSIKLDVNDQHYIPRIRFIAPEKLAVMTLNREQNTFKIFAVNPKSLLSHQMFVEKNPKYINNNWINRLIFEKNGGFVYVSERDGWAHIYRFSPLGQEVAKLTKGNFDVTDLYGVDDSGNIYYQAAAVSPMQREVYKVDTKGRITELSRMKGTNRAIFSSNFNYFIGSYSNANTPTLTALYRTAKPERPIRVLEDNARLKQKLQSYQVAKKEFMTIKTADGILLNAEIVKPVNFDPKKKYPVLMTQYSGPNSQEVLDRYGFGWEQFLAAKGVIVITVDGRGTGARGEAWRKCTYLKLGVLESHDQIEAAKTIAQLPYVDASRIGIWGWSFGGYNTLMSLTHGDVFKIGIAVAPVTDWRFYDSIYTERYMRTPNENPDGYKASSVLQAADKLKGNLLIIHGSADDNVQVQNTYDLTELLVQKNIPFDMAIYTDKNHSIYGGNTRLHLYMRMANFLFEQYGMPAIN